MLSEQKKRASRGQARLEFMSNEGRISEAIIQTPNLFEAWKALKHDGIVTIAYSTFCNAYRKVIASLPKTKNSLTYQSASLVKQAARISNNNPGSRKPIPENPAIKKFSLNTTREGNDKW